MSPIRYAVLLLPALCLAPARADFSYQQTSRMTGGRLMQFAAMGGSKATAPTATTVAVKGRKMVHVTEAGSTIIDIEAQTITHTNNVNKTYSVMTFEEMRNMLGGNSNVDVSDFKVDVKDGGNAKTVLGHETHDKIMTITSTVTDEKSGTKIDTVIHNDLYVASGIKGAEELKEFYKKAAGMEFAQAGGMPGMNRPELMKAMTKAYQSAGSMDGLPLYTVMTIDGTMPGMPPQMSGADGGKLAGLAAILAKRRQQQSGTPPPTNGAPDALMQMTMEVTGYSDKPVDAALFQIPEGYTRTDAPVVRRGAR